jgi:hypothetical protein
MPKGEKIRPKQEMDQLPLENCKNGRVEFCFVKYSYCLLVIKVCLLWGECLIMGKRGSVLSKYSYCLLVLKVCLLWGIFDQFLLEYLSLCLCKWIWLRDRKLSLICKNKPSGGKEWSKYAKFESKSFLVRNCIDIALLLVALCCVGINHQKGGDWKGNVPLGHF